MKTRANVSILLAASLATGCQSIQSESLRSLIEREDGQIQQARKNMSLLNEATSARIGYWQSAVAALDMALSNLRRIEAQDALISGSQRSFTTKTGADANAVGYLIGEVYLAEQAGLDSQVKQQFDDDAEALKRAASAIIASWEAINKAHIQLVSYSKQTGFSSVDTGLLASLAGEIPGAEETLQSVLADGKKVNDALQTAGATSLVGPVQTSGAQSAFQSLIGVLTNIGATPSTQPSVAH
ncbi:MAG TPA: hypothetical protein VG326_11540 [Tepidisphaeraceae bacterium]|nr:hypothetical protein [Tepidisphaeraceae bacterium]